MPVLLNSYPVYNAANTATTLTTPSFTPAAGEIIVVKLATWDTATSMGAPSGGGLTYTSRIIVATGGFNGWCGIYTASVSSSPGAMTISSTPSAASWHSMVVERWGSAALAASPAVNTTVTGLSTLPSATVTTTKAGSIVTWVNVDVASRNPSTRAYLSGAVEDGFLDGSSGTNGVQYFAYQDAPTAGAQTIGMSAPASQRWVMAGVEVQAVTTTASVIGFGVPIG